MTAIDLWRSAQSNTRDAANIMRGDIQTSDELVQSIDKALTKLRAATASMEALQRQSVGLPEPKRGE